MKPVFVEHDQVERLSRAHAQLRDDFDALLRCLEKRGGVSQAALHSERFSATLTRCPLAEGGLVPRFSDLLFPKVLQEVLQSCVGAELLALKETSSSARACIEPLQAEKLYAFGGNDKEWTQGSKEAESFDPRPGGRHARTGEWVGIKPMYFKRAAFVAGVIGGRIHVCCGPDPCGKFVETYNPKLQEWDTQWPAFQLSESRVNAAAATVGGRLYICGGEDTNTQTVHRSMEFYEPGPDGRTARGGMLPEKMQQPRRLLAVAALPGCGKVIMASGGTCRSMTFRSRTGGSCGEAYSSVELLDVGNGGAWTYGASLNWPRDAHSHVVLDGLVFAVGGKHSSHSYCPTLEHWDAEADAWIPSGAMPIARGLHASALVNGRAYVFGGRGNAPSAFRSSLCFDPRTGVWERAPCMLQNRLLQGFAVVKLAALAV